MHSRLATHLLDELEGDGVRDGGLGVGHGADDGDAARQRGRGTARVVLFVRGAGLAHVHMHIDQPRQPHHPARRHAVRVRLGVRRAADAQQRLHQQLGALDVRDERHRVVHGQAAGAVTVRHERRHAARAAIAHRQVDHQLELLLGQEVGQVHQLAVVALRRVQVLERPLHGLHLSTT